MELSRAIDQPRTWIIDLDGTMVLHNGHNRGEDVLLPGVLDFFKNLPSDDVVILTTAREEKFKDDTMNFLESKGIKVRQCIFGLPKGLRILINDKKPDGQETAVCVNLDRDSVMNVLQFVN